ncbi:UrcA family protein [Rhizomicrobium palustre]|uniref:UrcA family protein n=1 Tax=Rhizomicrobium palustre TaxID=189966 RepID=A0A846MW72_9PROT|nr:UrcA family protein [Rhizomicrobium palustre]NIK87237.1 UrcA family protein [Rhizomicrobium palustre]
MSRITRHSAFLLCAAALAATPAFAAGSVEVTGFTPTLGGAAVQKKVVVRFDDLDATDPQGAANLYQRLNLVAGKLCASNDGGNSALLTTRVEECRVKALAEAVKSVGTPALAAVAKK